MIKSINGICRLTQTFCHMLRHIPFILILQRMLNRRPEIHGHCTNLYLCLQLLWSLDRIHCIINNQMIASVTTLLNMFQIILLTLYNHIASLLDQRSNCLYILFKLTDNTDTRNILQFLFHSLHRNMLALHFLKNAAHTLNSALNLLDRAVNIVLFTFIDNVVEFHFQLSHSQFIRAQNASP